MAGTPAPGTLARALGVKLLVALCSIALCVGLAEATIRIVRPVPSADLLPLPYHTGELERAFTGQTYVQFDRELGWSNVGGASAVDGGVLYQAIAAGFRANREYALEPPLGVTRLAAFGDSFTHCDEVNYEDCWTSRLEEAWPGSEVLNFGIPASAPDQGWLRYQRDAQPYHPCAVLIDFQVENVNRLVNRFRPFYTPTTGLAFGKPRFVLDGAGLRLLPNPVASLEDLRDPLWIEQMLGPDDYWYFPGIFASGPMDNLLLTRLGRTALYQQNRRALQGTVDELHPNGRAYSSGDERFQVAGRVLTEFARQVRSDGATPVVIMIGQHREVVNLRHRDPKEYQPLLDWLQDAGIATIDVTDDLAREANRVGADALFARGGHFSRRGNQVVASGLARRLPETTARTCRLA